MAMILSDSIIFDKRNVSGFLTCNVSLLLIKSPREASLHLNGDFKEFIKEVSCALIETHLSSNTKKAMIKPQLLT